MLKVTTEEGGGGREGREGGGEGGEGLSGDAAGPDTRMAPLSGENFRKYSKAKSIERGVLIIINKAGV